MLPEASFKFDYVQYIWYELIEYIEYKVLHISSRLYQPLNWFLSFSAAAKELMAILLVFDAEDPIPWLSRRRLLLDCPETWKWEKFEGGKETHPHPPISPHPPENTHLEALLGRCSRRFPPPPDLDEIKMGHRIRFVLISFVRAWLRARACVCALACVGEHVRIKEQEKLVDFVLSGVDSVKQKDANIGAAWWSMTDCQSHLPRIWHQTPLLLLLWKRQELEWQVGIQLETKRKSECFVKGEFMKRRTDGPNEKNTPPYP